MSCEHEPARSTEPAAGAVTLLRVSKCYCVYDRPIDRLKQALLLHRRKYYREFWALRDVDLAVEPGEAVGVIGRNGAGKSTLLQIIAGTVTASGGSVAVGGRVSAMLELGAGFNLDYTGRENVFLSGAIIGVSRAEMHSRFDDIAAFADIGDFIDQPLRSYSTGMFARLAFAVAVSVEPDILLVDEILSVGDAEFQHRCLLRMRQLRERGVTLLLASHSMDTIKSSCERAIVLDGGKSVFVGSAEAAADAYLDLTREALDTPDRQESTGLQPGPADATRPPAGTRRYGTGHVQIESVSLRDAAGEKATAFGFGETLAIEVRYRALADVDCVSVSFLVRDPTGIDLFGTTTFDEGLTLPAVADGGLGTVRFEFANPLPAGGYGISVAVTRVSRRDLTDAVLLDRIDAAAAFNSLGRPDRPVYYKIHVPVTIATS